MAYSYSPYLACLLLYTWNIDFADEGDFWWLVGVVGSALDLDRVDAVFVHALSYVPVSVPSPLFSGPLVSHRPCKHTCGGPRIVPFQFVMSRSSPSSRPYEHASAIPPVLSQSYVCISHLLVATCAILPAPRPFSPFSSSSSSRKLRGTLAPMVLQLSRIVRGSVRCFMIEFSIGVFFVASDEVGCRWVVWSRVVVVYWRWGDLPCRAGGRWTAPAPHEVSVASGCEIVVWAHPLHFPFRSLPSLPDSLHLSIYLPYTNLGSLRRPVNTSFLILVDDMSRSARPATR